VLLIDDLLVWLPLKGVIAVIEQINNHIGGGEREETRLRKRLLELRLKYEMDELDEETYTAETAEVTQQLRELREREREEAEGGF
jgi:hypothetical protein